MTTKLNFTIALGVAERVREQVAARGRSAFVTSAIRERLDQSEKEQLRKALIIGYIGRCNEDAALNTEWEEPPLESWQ